MASVVVLSTFVFIFYNIRRTIDVKQILREKTFTRIYIYLYILLKNVEYYTVVYRIYLPNYCGTYLSEVGIYIYKYASMYHCEYYFVRNTLFQHSIFPNKLFPFAAVQLYYLTNKSIELNILLFGVICESDTIIIQHCIRSTHFLETPFFIPKSQSQCHVIDIEKFNIYYILVV